MQVGGVGQAQAILSLFQAGRAQPEGDEIARLAREIEAAKAAAVTSKGFLNAQGSVVAGLMGSDSGDNGTVLTGTPAGEALLQRERDIQANSEAFQKRWEGRDAELSEYIHVSAYIAADSAEVRFAIPSDREDAIAFAGMAINHMERAVSTMNYYSKIGDVKLEDYLNSDWAQKLGEEFARGRFEYDSNGRNKIQRAKEDFVIAQGIMRNMYGQGGDFLVHGDDGKYSIKPFEIKNGDDLLISMSSDQKVTKYRP